MALRCPDCGGALQIVAWIERRDDDWDEMRLQALRCSSCSLTAAGVYLEERRGARDRFHHLARRMESREFADFQGALQACASPGSRDCPCAAHRMRWDALPGESLPLEWT